MYHPRSCCAEDSPKGQLKLHRRKYQALSTIHVIGTSWAQPKKYDLWSAFMLGRWTGGQDQATIHVIRRYWANRQMDRIGPPYL